MRQLKMLDYLTKEFEDKEIHSVLNPLLSQWFKEKFSSFSPPQKYAVKEIHAGENTLITAPTGSGKTLSAFASILSELITLSEHDALENRVYCVYVSPLKALNNDIERNLNEPLKDIKAMAKKLNKKIDVRVAVRTGDTPQSQRSAMLRHPPHLLITTPESLAILLNSPKFVELLRNVKWLIIDEIHSLAENKRGTHLSLSMERLQLLSPELVRIGLSATISPIDEIARFLVGFKDGRERACKIADVQFLKKLDLNVISPLNDLINASHERLNNEMYAKLHELIQKHKTTLVFTNTRSGTERVVHNLKERYPKFYGSNIEAHHSSLSREHRLRVENRLKKGELKVVVSSTSLELGIDIGFIDLVVLLGSPKSISRALQRIGRSGHKLHDEIKGRMIVMNLDDLVECSVLAKNALEKKLDRIHIPLNALDVLSQQIYGMAIERQWNIDELFKVIRQSYPYHELGLHDFFEVIKYLAGHYAQLEVRHVYAKIWFDENTRMIGKRGKLARVLYMTNIGTIPDETRIKVKIGEQVIGSIDEVFLERLRKGDIFVLGGQVFEFLYARGMTVQVKANPHRPPTVPQWVSEMLPLSFDLAMEIQGFRKLMEEKLKAGMTRKEVIEFIQDYLHVEKNTAEAIHEYFKEQFLFLEIPHQKKLVIERHFDGEKRYLIFHSLFGRRTNDALSHALGFILGRLHHKDMEVNFDDNGFYIASDRKLMLEKALSFLKAKDFRQICENSIDNTEVLKRRFRHCAARALMILRSYKGKEKPVGRQQMSAQILINAVKAIDPNFPILKEARREVLEDLMDIDSALKVVQGIEEGSIKIKVIDSTTPSPFAWNLMSYGYSDIIKMEDRLAFIQRMHEKVMQEIKGK